jgi:hypothetical protein
VAVDEVPDRPVQVRLRRKLEELVGVEEADLLMDRPPGGWGALVTKDWLDERLTHERELTDERFRGIDLQFAALRHELLGKIDQAITAQTWRLAGLLISVTAIVVAALKI